MNALVAILSFFTGADSSHRSNKYPSFDQWMTIHDRTYTVGSERDYRNSVYDANVQKIYNHNHGNHSWRMSVNKFADLTADEFKH